MQDFKNMEQIYDHVQSTLIIDLIKHALTLDENCTSLLIDSDPGLYLPGNFEPTFYASKTYYRRGGMVTSDGRAPSLLDDEETSRSKRAIKGSVVMESSLPISDILTIPKSGDDIYDEKLNLVMPGKDVRLLARHFRQEPTIPAIAVRMAIGIVQKTVSTMCRHAASGYQRYRPDRLVRENIDPDIDVYGDFENAFERLLVQVTEFIGDDTWNYYTYKIRGGTLVIQKGLDWRISEYYRMKFEQEEAEHQED